MDKRVKACIAPADAVHYKEIINYVCEERPERLEREGEHHIRVVFTLVRFHKTEKRIDEHVRDKTERKARGDDRIEPVYKIGTETYIYKPTDRARKPPFDENGF